MDVSTIFEVSRYALFALLKISSVIVLPGMIVGVLISMFQAMTQIQEMTLSFVPKFITVLFSILIFSSFIKQELLSLVFEVFDKI